MKYGSTTCALEYAGRGAIDEWVQLFLRNDGENLKFADWDWDFPPLIVNYAFGRFEINDGRHRNIALHQMNITRAPVIFWTSSEEDHRYITDHIRRTE